jgi:hypothetical protein
MRINRIEEIATLCREHDVVPRGELIWGLPESYEQFCIPTTISRITPTRCTYIRITLPNTGYIRKRRIQIAMEQGELDTDYFIVGHRDMSREDFMKGLRFIVSTTS